MTMLAKQSLVSGKLRAIKTSKQPRSLLGLTRSLVAGVALLGGLQSASAVELLRLSVDTPGMQRVTYSELASEGLDLRGLRTRRLNVTINGESVPMRVTGQTDGSRAFFGPGSYIEFYAESAESLYTTEQLYTVHFLNNRELRSTERKRIRSVNGRRTNATVNAATSYTHTDVVEENNFYDFAAPSQTDPWHYGQNFSIFPTPTYNFELKNVVGGSAVAELEAEMYGLLDFDIEGNDHHYEVEINGNIAGDQQFDGNSIDTFNASNVVISEGANTFKYNFRPIEGVPFDIVTLNRFKVSYPRLAIAENNYLEGRFAAGHSAVSGISVDEDFSVYRKLENGNIQRITRAERVSDGKVLFNAGNQAGDYIVVGQSGYGKPTPEALLSKRDITTGSADYLIIANQSLMGAELDQLVELRSQRYAVKVVDVEQVYNQFGDGVVDSQPIYDYIKFAKANMGVKFVVLLGNDSYDYKGFGNTGSVSLIPTRYVSTPGGRLIVTQTPSDAAYGDLDGDRVPDLPIGRISVRNKTELQAVVNKLNAYEARQGYAGRVLVAADQEDNGNGISFTQDAEALIAAMPATWRDSIRNDFRAYPDVDGGLLAHEKTLRAINAGVSVVNFIGHSSHRRWSFSTPPMLRSNQIASLTNIGKPALVTQWGCWNSYFVDPAGNTMADEFLLANEGGAATVLGASTLTTSTEERALGVELNKRMYNQGLTIGEAVIQAKQALAQREDFPAVQLGWQIIGDPALMVNP